MSPFIILFLSECDVILAEAQIEWTDVFRSYANLDENIRIPVSTCRDVEF
jgi:hypothetical protein